ncbi:hypothetical protein RHMOL_Rhmol08G0036700 [Rhododendron molle]|uniref:Uncharacterized protein n=1 Tax=Rhododendron molle TaxID=49168 RepID=A0ACC0MJD7_RHOML|nr:hypothetical protein RHMOL_Rhmol08G0036700 [Rhododendron molle]
MAFYGHHSSYRFLLITTLSIILYESQSSDGLGNFGFDIHHRYSDQVKRILDADGLPEMGSVEFYAAMAHRDRLVRQRKLAATAPSAPLTFLGGNDTYRIRSLGYLHYANVSVGSPGLWFLVALDTGSNLFWLPCDCTRCVHALVTSSGHEIDLNIYSPNKSSTSTKLSCNSTFCGQKRRCLSESNVCAYQVQYLSNGTSSTGILVEDTLHLTTDDSRLTAVDARITFGCGLVQSGSFLSGGAPNGLFGLGMDNISVPSILAKEGLAANSFSMCFGPDGVGRIRFGDKITTEQGETPFNLNQTHPTYNVSMTQVSLGDNVTDISFGAIFDSGTSFTYLNDPAYSAISESFNSQAQEKRHPPDDRIPFEYCYNLSANQTSFNVSSLNLTMKGGKQFHVTHPIVTIPIEGEGYLYCLAIIESGDINIIGQNFMTGYRIVFDREKMVLGWESSNCYDAEKSSTSPVNPPEPSAIPPTSGGGNGSPIPSPRPSSSASDFLHLYSFPCTLFLVFISLFGPYFSSSSP